MSYAAVIIDDESDARDTLYGIIEHYAPAITVVAMADNVQSGIEIIKKHDPQIVFLDIEMPEGTGFDVLQAFERPNFEVIFTTAHDTYALRALKMSAIDYLLKPIDKGDLQASVEKARDAIDKQQLNNKLETFLSNISNKEKQELKIVIPVSNGFKVLMLKEIVYLQADRNYTTLHFRDSKPELASKSLKEFDDMLSDKGFFRSHQSFLVNMNYVTGFTKGPNSTITVQGNTEIALARSKKSAFTELFEG